MHKFHHHLERPWTNTNYGNVLSIWDRLFGTFVYESVSQVRYGVDTVDGNYSDDLIYQFKLPFNSTIKTDQA
jgi:sterol desaturase/sphingolipid hydroxylase (fatty acid hydroxylase superfamily)